MQKSGKNYSLLNKKYEMLNIKISKKKMESYLFTYLGRH